MIDLSATPPQPPSAAKATFLGVRFNLLGRDTVVRMIAAGTAQTPFRYVVTPNVDHATRISRDGQLGRYYTRAWLTLCDSNPIRLLAHTRGIALSHITGSDLTITLFEDVIKPGDLVSLIVAEEAIADEIRAANAGVTFRSHAPPYGLLEKPDALQAAIDFVVAANARFVLIAIGSPQSERIAYELSALPSATGTAICIGASLEFMIGKRQRAPKWMQRLSLEWLHRVMTEPRRLWKRYAFSVPPLVRLYVAELTRRR